MDVDGNKRVFQRPGGAPNGNNKQFQKVCFHWRAGKCTRHPCPYLHRELPAPPMHHNTNGGGGGMQSSKRGHGFSEESGFSGVRQRTANFNNSSTWGRVGGNRVEKKTDKVCNYWIQGNCGYGDRCKFLHSWSLGDVLSLTQLEGHQKVVTGIAFPSGSDKLYSVSKDETMKLWDCQSGQCTGTLNLGGEVGCVISEGTWLFFGLPNLVKAWNTQTNSDLSLSGPIGQVYALVVGNSLLFAGTQDGSILIWKFNPVTNNFDPAASLKGHTLAVVSLVVGANRLYSGSMDTTIRAWDLETLQCIQTLTDHTAVVMSVLCWDQFLLSCSLDKTIKVWVATDSGNLEVTYTHTEEHGILTLCGMHDSESKPILLSSCNDNCVRLYDLPSFMERGKVFTKEEVRAIQTGPIGLFFTGDGAGQVKVWKLEASAGTT